MFSALNQVVKLVDEVIHIRLQNCFTRLDAPLFLWTMMMTKWTTCTMGDAWGQAIHQYQRIIRSLEKFLKKQITTSLPLCVGTTNRRRGNVMKASAAFSNFSAGSVVGTILRQPDRRKRYLLRLNFFSAHNWWTVHLQNAEYLQMHLQQKRYTHKNANRFECIQSVLLTVMGTSRTTSSFLQMRGGGLLERTRTPGWNQKPDHRCARWSARFFPCPQWKFSFLFKNKLTSRNS